MIFCEIKYKGDSFWNDVFIRFRSCLFFPWLINVYDHPTSLEETHFVNLLRTNKFVIYHFFSYTVITDIHQMRSGFNGRSDPASAETNAD